jgi:hypothetical protein
VERYAEPGPYKSARAALAADRVVVLSGPRGCGKRTGGIVLLRDVLPADAPIVSLPPTATLDQLAKKKDYVAGRGYVVFDRLSTEKGREADHQWDVVRGRVSDSGAYLVVTTREQDGHPHESVRRIGWERPALATALRVHLGDTAADEVIADVEELMSADYTMADLVKVTERMVDGATAIDAVAAVLDQSELRAVEEWFAQDLTPEQIRDVTTQGFHPRVGARDFERYRSELETHLAKPPPTETGQEPTDTETRRTPTAQPGVERMFKHDLIRLEKVVLDGVPRKLLVFKKDGYRRHVLEKLIDKFDIDSWDGVRKWLQEGILETHRLLPIASGLALLCHLSFDEVENSFLKPWSSGSAGWAGRYAAASTLWFMCLDEELRPIALRTADRWASYGSSEARFTAIVAFAGELGVRYPTEASRRLWQLIKQPNDLSLVAADAFGDLFANLISREGGGRQVVNHLSKQVTELTPFGRNRLLYKKSLLRAALAVVQARNPGTRRSAIIEYLCKRPEEIGVVARMWAALLRHRPFRSAALTALHNGLQALDTVTSSASDYARRLGDALGDALPEKERAQLAHDFAKRTRNPNHADRSVALAKILITALEAARRRREE